MKEDINIMWRDSGHNIVFAHSSSIAICSTTIEYLHLRHTQVLKEFKTSSNGEGSFPDEKKKTHAHQLTWNIAFKAWWLKKDQFFSKNLLSYYTSSSKESKYMIGWSKYINFGSEEKMTYGWNSTIRGRF
jgi:hypothetical protein